MIKAEGVSQIYPDGTKGLDNFSLQIRQGEFVAVIGPSGAGKSTFLRLINGMLKLQKGDLEVLGVNLKSAPGTVLRQLRSKVGFIYQQFNLVKGLSVFQNVLLGRLGYRSTIAGTLGLFTDEDKNLAMKYLREVGLEEKIEGRVENLSGGQQQRVAIARALVQDPKIILADEPMASLDPHLSDVILGLLKEFNEKKNITIIVNIHILDLAKRYAPRIVGLNHGRLIYDGPPSGLTDSVLRDIYEKT